MQAIDEETEFDVIPISTPQPSLQRKLSSCKDEFANAVLGLKEKVSNEYVKLGVNAQFARDVKMWRLTLADPVDASQEPVQKALDKQRRDILRRIFCILRYGGLMFRQVDEKSDIKYPNVQSLKTFR